MADLHLTINLPWGGKCKKVCGDISQNSMSKAKKQHWVPQFYLKEFAIEETKRSKKPQVWIFSKTEGDPVRVNVGDIAAKRYLYSPKKKDGSRSWEMENRLAELESAVSMFWPDIARGYVDLNEEDTRKIVALFIATLILRHPDKINTVKQVHGQIVEYLDRLPQDEHGNPNVNELETRDGRIIPLDSSDWEAYKNSSDADHQETFIQQLQDNAYRMAKTLRRKRWSIVISEDPIFITTDRPVAIFNQKREMFGLETKGTFINFPLSPTRVLVMDDRHEEPASQYYSLAETGPAPANLTSWTHAHEFMISSRHPDEINLEFAALGDVLESRGLL